MSKHPCIIKQSTIKIKIYNILTKTSRATIALGGNNLDGYTMKFHGTNGNKKLDLKTMSVLLFCKNSFVSSPHMNYCIWQNPLSPNRIPVFSTASAHESIVSHLPSCLRAVPDLNLLFLHPHSWWFSSLWRKTQYRIQGMHINDQEETSITFSP